MKDEQLEIIKQGMENGIPLRQTILQEGWVEVLSVKTARPFHIAFVKKYGKAEFNRLYKMLNPSLLKGLQTAAKATRRAARAALNGKQVLVDRDTRRERLATCLSCPLLQEKGSLATCSICSCNVRKKTRYATEECPEGKWGL